MLIYLIIYLVTVILVIYYVYGMRITVLRIYESTAFGLETCSVHWARRVVTRFTTCTGVFHLRAWNIWNRVRDNVQEIPMFYGKMHGFLKNQSSEGLFPFPPKGPSNDAYTWSNLAWLCLVGESNRFHDSNTLRAPNCGAYPRVQRQTPPANSTQAAPCSVRKVASDSETTLVLPLSVSKHGKAFQSRFKSQNLLKWSGKFHVDLS